MKTWAGGDGRVYFSFRLMQVGISFNESYLSSWQIGMCVCGGGSGVEKY